MELGDYTFKTEKDFSLEINYELDTELDEDDSFKKGPCYKYFVCLKCHNPECLSVNKMLEDEYNWILDPSNPDSRREFERELCLIKIELSICKEMTIQSNKGEEINYRIFLDAFYNNALKYGKGISYLNPKLKGAGAALFFIILQSAVLNKRINKNDTIVLLASGDLDENEDMRRLVEYYEKLGFEMINPENLEEDLESVTMSVPMKGTVENILNKTMSRFPLVSKEFLDILKKLV
jgi:hypothetical protein